MNWSFVWALSRSYFLFSCSDFLTIRSDSDSSSRVAAAGAGSDVDLDVDGGGEDERRRAASPAGEPEVVAQLDRERTDRHARPTGPVEYDRLEEYVDEHDPAERVVDDDGRADGPIREGTSELEDELLCADDAANRANDRETIDDLVMEGDGADCDVYEGELVRAWAGGGWELRGSGGEGRKRKVSSLFSDVRSPSSLSRPQPRSGLCYQLAIPPDRKLV